MPRLQADNAPCQPNSPRTRPSLADDSEPARRPSHPEPTQPNKPASVTPYSGPSLPATQPATAAECHAEPQDHRQAASQFRLRTAALARCQTQAQAQTWHHSSSANPTPRGCPLQLPPPAIRDPAAAPSTAPPTVTDAASTTFIAERAAAEARRTSSRHPAKPAPQAKRPPPTGPEESQGQPAASPPLYQPPMSATSSRCPATAATTDPNQTRKRRPCAPTQGSTYAQSLLPTPPHGTGPPGLRRAPHRHQSP